MRRFAAMLLAAAAGCARPAMPPPAPEPAPVDTTPPAPVDTAPLDTVPRSEPAPAVVRGALAVTLAFTGDINLGTTTLPDGVPPDDGRGLLGRVDTLLRADLVVGNFEGVLADSGTSEKCLRRVPGRRAPAPRPNCHAFITPTRLAPRLVEAGFTHLNLANNHAQDLGPGGRLATDSILRSLGLETYGPLGRIALDTLRRGDSLTVVALVGFTTYPFAYNLLEIERSAAVVDSVRRLADVVVVTFHGGAEGARAVHTDTTMEFLGNEPRGDLRRWARAVIDAGAHAVVGHGPHVLRGIEFHRGRPIAYSLGNFLTYRGFNLSGPLGITGVLRLELGGNGALRGARLAPLVQIPRRGPVPDERRRAIELVRRLSREDFGPTAATIDDDGTIRPPPDPVASD
ncbi:MAG TPA: CapA family protein [Gemmatimonadales bacterium]|nr:CapA family protein [Gemmatimonadales bacterium]